ncbi:Uncharacterized protein TCM_026773 [Theobroma cacao]|uniref:Uncharacterized protein n=1 Tax=Theobroma cacao TaxID=3641 RepID=A0A061FB47_THECC|nr:Uncharacterized protein TCM_026773 [Theobroma cacao]
MENSKGIVLFGFMGKYVCFGLGVWGKKSFEVRVILLLSLMKSQQPWMAKSLV